MDRWTDWDRIDGAEAKYEACAMYGEKERRDTRCEEEKGKGRTM